MKVVDNGTHLVPAELLARFPEPVDSVLDIGCGIRPQGIVKAHVHVCVDPHRPYLERLKEEGFAGQFVCESWDKAICHLPDDSFSAVFALDVIEHLPRQEGLRLLDHAQRVCSGLVVVFTPDGPFPQFYEAGERDAWGMDGGYWQTHRSAWTPDDFTGWDIYELPGFHTTDADERPLEEPISAFWAVT